LFGPVVKLFCLWFPYRFLTIACRRNSFLAVKAEEAYHEINEREFIFNRRSFIFISRLSFPKKLLQENGRSAAFPAVFRFSGLVFGMSISKSIEIVYGFSKLHPEKSLRLGEGNVRLSDFSTCDMFKRVHFWSVS